MTYSRNSNSLHQPSRCQHLTAKRRRCRQTVVNAQAGLCFRHLAKLAARQSAAPVGTGPIQLDSRELLNATADLGSLLAGGVREFKAANEINEFLGRLLMLLAENRVTPRRAAVMAYVCNLLLRTILVGHSESKFEAGSEEPPRIDLGDLFKPGREDDTETPRASDPASPVKIAS